MHLRIFIVVAFMAAFPAVASEIAPSTKPIPANISGILGDIEFAHFRRAMRSVADKDWDQVRGYRAGITHPAAIGIIDWQLALQDQNAIFFDLADAVRTLEGWPRHQRIRVLAERKIATSGMQPTAIISWFAKWPAISGPGKLALAEALFTNSQPELAKALVIDAWRHHSLSKDISAQVLKTHGDVLETHDHEIRVDMLLWQRRSTAARRLLSKTSRDFRDLSKARIALMRRGRGVDTAVDAVPATLQTHISLLFERALWRRKAGRTGEALELLLQLPEIIVTPQGQKRLWTERHIHARRALKDGNYEAAYQLAKAHGFERGADFAAGEWLAGWLALTKLQQPEIAKQHFTKLAENVSTPVSQARARYWLGETWRVLDNPENAKTEYLQAAVFNFTYYGQLAQQQIAPGYLNFGNDPEPGLTDRHIFETHPQVQAMKLLAMIGDLPNYRRFSYHLDDLLPGAVDHVMLARFSRKNGQGGIAIRAAKAALIRNEILPESQWPLMAVPTDSNRPEPAFLLAISRQESEFNARAISPAGARGLMQLMPATAKQTARNQGRTYHRGWLTDDPAYNLDLGSAHLQELLDNFDGSYILSAAAYNAGSRRAKQWIKDYGDPRTNANPIDWVESIPFSETRNYVQRVLENVQVYRNRLSTEPTLIRLNEDLNRGR